MNKFGQRAMELWQMLAPAAYAQITNPKEHFSSLGETALNEWATLWPQMVDPDTPGEDTMHKIGRINTAQAAAREIIEADWLMPPAELIEDDDPQVPDPWAKLARETYLEQMNEEGLDPDVDLPPWLQ